MQYATTARALAEAFEHVKFKQILREDNAEADILAKISASTVKGIEDQLIIDIEMPSVNKIDVHMVEERESKMPSIIQFLKNKILYEDKNEVKNLKYRATRYTLQGNSLTSKASQRHS